MSGAPAEIRVGPTVRISARADYGVRALTVMARADAPVSAPRIAADQEIPLRFLYGILGDLQRAGLVRTRRGVAGGFSLARPADEVSLAEVVLALSGGAPLRESTTNDPIDPTDTVAAAWLGAQRTVQDFLGGVSLADLAGCGIRTAPR